MSAGERGRLQERHLVVRGIIHFEAGLRARFVVNGDFGQPSTSLKSAAPAVDTRSVHTSLRPADEAGFSIVEVLVAAVILVTGALVAFSLIDGANKSISLNSARIGATNLARELIEYARGTDYDKLQPGQVVPALQERLGGSGAPWTLQRRGITYTVAVAVCTFDDPKDGLAATAPANACPPASPIAGVTAIEQNPDDFRRVTVTLTWRARGVNSRSEQSALIVNPAGGLGPRITDFQPVNSEVTSGAATSWSPTVLTSTPATAVTWNANDGVSQGNATGGPAGWAFTWPLGAPKLTPITVDGTWVVDGTYTVAAQAKDSRGVPGEARMVNVRVNRHRPAQVPDLSGGFNARHGGVVDMHWQPYPERDLLGYRVRRRSDPTWICGPSGGDEWTQTRCTDPNPGSGTRTYEIFAVDCDVPSLTTCTARTGDPTELTIDLSAGAPPPAPTSLTVTWEENLPRLVWLQPPTGSNILFYRIYRDGGTGLADRYDETITNDTAYSDPNPRAATIHTYYVTAVDENFNESAPSSPATITPLS